MKKARKVKIGKELWKYFVDNGAKEERDENPHSTIILYSSDNKTKYRCDLSEKRPVAASEVKKLWAERKFC